MFDLSIVIPCYNEADSLYQLFEACANIVSDDFKMEVVFVDNGSTDHSDRVFDELLNRPKYSFGRKVNVSVNKGYGYGIMAGVREAKGTVIGWTHADLQTDPADVTSAYLEFREELEGGKVIVKGRRMGRSQFDIFFTAGMSIIASAMIGIRMSDINAQPKIFPRLILDHLTTAPDDFSLDVYLLYVASKAGLQVYEYPVDFIDRQYGEAKGGGSFIGKMKLIRRTLSFLARLRHKIKEELR